MGRKPAYYAKGLTIHKSPVSTVREGGTSISLGFQVATVSDYIGKEQAATLAEMLCVAEAAPELVEALKVLDAYWTADLPEGPDGSRTALGGLGQVSDDTMGVWRKVRAALSKAGVS